jgi:hypothetical protein
VRNDGNLPRLLIGRDTLIAMSATMCTSANAPANLDTIFSRNQATRACYTLQQWGMEYTPRGRGTLRVSHA